MGVAFLADGLGQWAVVKVIRSELADDPGFRSRVARELDAVGRLDGQSARVLADGLGDAVPWFAMEFIEGQTLDHRVRDRGPLRGGDLVGFAGGVAGVLAGVHAAGIVHRDVKPSNVMMSPSGPRLIDFGIAEVDEGTQLTRTGSVMGSLGWLAPEQVRGDATGPATDVHAWALCVVFAATGDAPFGSDTSAAAMYRVLEATPQVPESVPEPLRGLLQGALAKEPARRPTLDQVDHGLGMPAPAAPRWSGPAVEAGTSAAASGGAPGASAARPTAAPPSVEPPPAPVSAASTPVSAASTPPVSSPPSGMDTLPPVPAGASLREVALAEALRREPQLRAATDSQSLARLATSTDAIERELRLRQEILAIQAKEQAAEQEARRREQAAAEEARRRELAAAEEARRRELAERRAAELVAMPAPKRWLLTHKALAVVLAVALVAVIGGTTAVVIGNTRAAAEAAALEAARAEEAAALEAARAEEAAALEAAKASCDLLEAGDADTDPVLLEAWAACPDPAVRRAVAGNAAAPVEVREGLRQDPDTTVSQAVALIGLTGPGGGIVFYDAGSQQSWGRYLEAAPAGWSGSAEDPRLVWCPRNQPEFRPLHTGVDVGSGRSNTALIVQQCGSDTAAGAAAGYRGGGKDDWFLPSKEELDALYQQRSVVGALADGYFWSSSQYYVDYANLAWYLNFGNGYQDNASEVSDYRVRPVRAF